MSQLGPSSADNFRSSAIEVCLDSLLSNYRNLRSLVKEGELFCPMVKANAYGHGLVKVAKTLSVNKCKHLGVAMIEEAIQLRESGLREVAILVFCNFDKNGAKAIVENTLTPVVSQWSALEVLDEVAKSEMNIHLKFNTGMERLGFAEDDIEGLKVFLEKSKFLRIEGVCTHLVEGETWEQGKSISAAQSEIFAGICGHFETKYKHLLNSSGLMAQYLLNDKEPVAMGARPGLSLYGTGSSIVLESGGKVSAPVELKPVMTLRSSISQCHEVNSGQGVSYNHRWKARRDSLIGLVPIGYGDGYHRAASNRAEVLVSGRRAPVRGTICMDSMLVDLTDIFPDAESAINSEVVLLGSQADDCITSTELSGWIDSIAYEVTTSLNRRLPRHYLGGGESYVS